MVQTQARWYINEVETGSRGWISHVAGYSLPWGLENHMPVRVVRLNQFHAVVQTPDGREWEVENPYQVDCGYSFDLDGTGLRLPERHPRVLDYLEHKLHELRETPCAAISADGHLELIAKVKWILQRNGRQPPPAEDVQERRMEHQYEAESDAGIATANYGC